MVEEYKTSTIFFVCEKGASRLCKGMKTVTTFPIATTSTITIVFGEKAVPKNAFLLPYSVNKSINNVDCRLDKIFMAEFL